MSVVNGFQVGSETLKYNYESLENYNTPEFSTSSSKTYTVGDYVMHNGKLYKCTIATTGGTWDVNNWEEAILSDDVAGVKNTILVQDAQPTEPYNKIWVDPNNDEFEIPLTNDMQTLYTEVEINDIQNIATYNGLLSGGKIQSNPDYRLLYVPCSGEQRYHITRHDYSYRFRICTIQTAPLNNVPFSGYLVADDNTDIYYTTPTDAVYLVVWFYTVSQDSAHTVAEVATDISIKALLYGEPEYIAYINNADQQSILKNGIYTQYQKIAKRYYLDDNNIWTDTESQNSLHICYPVSAGDSITVITGEVETKVAFFADQSAVYNTVKSVIGEVVTIDSNSAFNFVVSDGANYIYMSAYVSGLRLPVRLEINGTDVMKAPETELVQYETVFFDDFDNDGLSDKWILVDMNANVPSSYISKFTDLPDLAYVDSGCLVLKSRLKRANEDIPLGTDKWGNARTMVCGYISSQNKFAMRKGRISAKIRTSDKFGSGHPWTFFTFGQNHIWPQAVEYDIAEDGFEILESSVTTSDGRTYPAGSAMQIFWANTHYLGADAEDKYLPYNYNIGYAAPDGHGGWEDFDEVYTRGIDPSEWHVYSVEFDEHVVIYKVDGIFVNSINISDLSHNSDWMCPKDIRLNIKTSVNAKTNDDSFLYVDWVKAEAEKKQPVEKIQQNDIVLHVGDSYYVNPTFTPSDSTNLAFNMESDNTSVVTCYNNHSYGWMVYHRLDAVATGTAHITLTTAHGDLQCTFSVTVN